MTPISHGRLLLSVLFSLGALTVAAPSTSASTPSGARMAHCMQTLSEHSPATKSGIADCNGMPLLRHHCASGGAVTVIKLGGSTVALRPGHAPVRLGSHYTVGRLNKLCRG